MDGWSDGQADHRSVKRMSLENRGVCPGMMLQWSSIILDLYSMIAAVDREGWSQLQESSLTVPNDSPNMNKVGLHRMLSYDCSLKYCPQWPSEVLIFLASSRWVRS